MGNNSAIEWTDTTWNPLAGCTWASPGCDHCYAAVMARRLDAMAQADIAAGRDPGAKAKYIGITHKNNAGRVMFNGRVNLDPFALDEPLRWKKPRRVFVNSMSDLFHKDVPDAFIARVWDVMAQAHRHTFQVLTKRPERMAELVPQFAARHTARDGSGWPLAHVWIGTSVENQPAADERIPHLLRVPARVRFLSCEPLLGPVNVARWLCCPWCGDGDRARQDLNGTWYHENDGWARPCPTTSRGPAVHTIDWVIVGGESGRAARPMHPDWARSLRDQCQAAGVAYHFKQWGEYKPSPWIPEPNAKPHFALAVEHDGSHVYAQVGHIAGFRSPTEVCMERVGKHAAGRVLDGRTWDELPNGG